MLTVVQNRRLARRLFIAANVRVDELPSGWAIARLTVPTKSASRAKPALLDGAFRHVETTYYHHAEHAQIAAAIDP